MMKVYSTNATIDPQCNPFLGQQLQSVVEEDHPAKSVVPKEMPIQQIELVPVHAPVQKVQPIPILIEQKPVEVKQPIKVVIQPIPVTAIQKPVEIPKQPTITTQQVDCCPVPLDKFNEKIQQTSNCDVEIILPGQDIFSEEMRVIIQNSGGNSPNPFLKQC